MSVRASYEPSDHYDRVTNAWRLIMGEELHYGVFSGPEEDLASATANLTQLMIRFADLSAGQSVLDIGCGTGDQACALAERFGVTVLGITPSVEGVKAATAKAAKKQVEGVTFECRDGMDNGLPDESFDRVWALESSHLMRDRAAFVSECARVLRRGGRLVMCDIVRMREIPFDEVRRRRAEFATLRAAFGDSHMEPMDDYVTMFGDNRLALSGRVDLTDETLTTFARWRANLESHRKQLEHDLGRDDVEAFADSTTILERFWRDGTLGYGLLAATKG